MKTCAHVLLTILIPVLCSAQGYEWEWSPRLPAQMPKRYVGIELTGGYAWHSSGIVYSEVSLPCCEFTTGGGIPVGLTIQGEQWVEPWLAITAGLGVMYQKAWLTAAGDTLPRIDANNTVRQVITEWQMDASLTYGVVAVGGRARIGMSHALVGFQIRGLFSLSGAGTLTERILAPDDFYFSYQGTKTKERSVESSNLTQRSAFYLEPALSVQYDLPLKQGYVLTPLVQVTMPITSLSATGDWRYVGLSLGMRLSRGI